MIIETIAEARREEQWTYLHGVFVNILAVMNASSNRKMDVDSTFPRR